LGSGESSEPNEPNEPNKSNKSNVIFSFDKCQNNEIIESMDYNWDNDVAGHDQN
jgi:hypothetical protein